MDGAKFEDNKIIELVLGGDLQTNQCDFPMSENYIHIKNPFLVYSRCVDFISKNWDGEKKTIGLIEMQMQLDKGVEKKKDFLSYSNNEYLEEETNEILKDVFLLIREISEGGHVHS